MVADAVSEISLIDFAPRTRFGSDNIVFRLCKVESVLGSVIDFESDLGSSVILRNVKPQPSQDHLSFMIYRSLEGIAPQASLLAAGRRNNVDRQRAEMDLPKNPRFSSTANC